MICGAWPSAGGCVSQSGAGGTGGTVGSGGNEVGGSATGGSSGGMTASGGRGGSGGVNAASGGSSSGGRSGSGGNASGGTTGGSPTGGSPTGGMIGATGGAATGGATSGTGGSGTAGSKGSGGQATGGSGTAGVSGGGTCSGAAEDPTAASTISCFLDTLPYNNPKDPARTQIIDAIIKACVEFGPPPASNPGWMQEYCWAHLTAAIEKESSYTVASNVADTYGMRTIKINSTTNETANDPTMGLLQIRFSSTVHDYEQLGPLDHLACVGCTFPDSFAAHKSDSGDSDFWAVTGPTQNLDLMTNVACNVGLGAWYYYTYATGNGNASKVTYLSDYCKSGGTGADLVTGLLSHLEGPDPAKGVITDMAGLTALGTTSGGYMYVNQIMLWFNKMVTVSGTSPFFLPLMPNKAQYCAN
jgi:hypothetical protein